MSSGELYAVGKIVKVFGVKGELVVKPMTDSVQRFKALKQVFIGLTDVQAEAATVEYVRIQPHGVRIKIAAVKDRTSAEKYVGALLFVGEKDKVRIPKGKFFVHDVVGMRVLDEHQNTVGTVTEVLRLPANDVYVIDGEGWEVMLPAVKEFVKEIDVKTKTMRVVLIEGMVESR